MLPKEESGRAWVAAADVAALARHARLTKREAEVLGMLARGRTGRSIAFELGISTNTVKTHVRHIYAKLDGR